MGLFAIYVVLVVLCCVKASNLYTVVERGALSEIDDVSLDQVIANISQDEAGCFHCVERHVGFTRLKAVIRKKQLKKQEEGVLREVHTFFNVLSITNTIVNFVIFGEPRSIFLISLVSCLWIFGSIFVERPTDAIPSESAVILISCVVIFKSSHVIISQIGAQIGTQMILLDRRRNVWIFFCFSASSFLLLTFSRSNWSSFSFVDCEIPFRLLPINGDLNGQMSSYSDAYADANANGSSGRSSSSSSSASSPSNFDGKIDEKSRQTNLRFVSSKSSRTSIEDNLFRSIGRLLDYRKNFSSWSCRF